MSESGEHKTSRAKLACSECRANKIRCQRDPNPSLPCARCTRFGLNCQDPPKGGAKGRPPKRARPDTGSPSCLPQIDGVMKTSDFSGQTGISQTDMSPMLPHSQVSFPTNAQAMSTGVNIRNPASSLIDHAPPPTSSNILSLTEYLDPGSKNVNTSDRASMSFGRSPTTFQEIVSAKPPTVGEYNDPITLHVLGELEALSLVNQFHSHLNSMVAVLDSNLHSLSYLRQTSPVLCSIVLASTARFFRKDLYPMLASHAATMLDRACILGQADIGIVQSLMLSTYWKAPEDTSAWRKIGMAVRMAYSFSWHIRRTKMLPEDEFQAREILNVERTWFCLFSFDRGLGFVYKLPPAIRTKDMSDTEHWARSHTYLGPSVDMHVSASYQFCHMKEYWYALAELDRPDVNYTEQTIETLEAQCDMFFAKWFSLSDPPPAFNPDEEHVLRWSILDFVFLMRSHRYNTVPHDAIRLDACLATSSRIADEIHVLSGNGELRIMQDTASCMTSALVEFLRNVFRHASRSQKTNIVSLLHRIHVSYVAASLNEVDTATNYVTRFLHRTLSALDAESRAGSPGPLTEQGDFNNEPQYDIFAELGLTNFAPLSEDVGANDEQYWARLFSV